jgi:alcohol dehydrogenase (cytochrome c)
MSGMSSIRLIASASALGLILGGVSCARIPAVGIPGRATDARDWPAYNRTLAGDRFSPIAEIDRTNVSGLKQICAYTLPEVTSLQTGPIVIDGTMYFTTDTISYAIDASSCAEKWKQVRHSPTPSSLAVNRGFAYMDGRLFRGTSDSHVLAIDPLDGHVLWDATIDAAGHGVTIPMAPVAAHGLVFVGNAGGDAVGVTGHVYAFDARDGHQVWKFDVVPSIGPTVATWPNAPNVPMSGGAFWTSFTYDAQNNVLYVPAGNPAPDFDIEMRRGDNLYTNSVIALDGSTGRMLGYNQLVKHDTHDWDVDSPPMLATTTSGRAIVASANKNGLLSILDRSRLGTARVDIPAGNLGTALPLIAEMPTTTRENVDVPLSRDRVVHFCPGITGGTEWNGAAYSPALNSIFVGAVDLCANVKLQPRDAPIPGAGETWLAAGNPFPEIADAPEKARGWVTSFDADNGAVRWKKQLPHPVLAGVTPTAGGVVFTADLGGVLYALDASDGRILWQLNSGQSAGGGVISYYAGGRQLIGIASGMKSSVWPGAAEQSRIVVFGLR